MVRIMVSVIAVVMLFILVLNTIALKEIRVIKKEQSICMKNHQERLGKLYNFSVIK